MTPVSRLHATALMLGSPDFLALTEWLRRTRTTTTIPFVIPFSGETLYAKRVGCVVRYSMRGPVPPIPPPPFP